MLEVGCGDGVLSIALAQSFPAARVRGYDIDPGAIQRACTHVQEAGLGDRVILWVADCMRLPRSEFDLILTVDGVDEVADPIGLLTSIRNAIRTDGTYLNVTPATVGRSSVLDGHEARELAQRAGFSRFRRVPILDPRFVLQELMR